MVRSGERRTHWREDEPEAHFVVEDFQLAFDGCPVPNTLLAMENRASMMREA